MILIIKPQEQQFAFSDGLDLFVGEKQLLFKLKSRRIKDNVVVHRNSFRIIYGDEWTQYEYQRTQYACHGFTYSLSDYEVYKVIIK